MYTILLNESNELIHTVREVIMQRSKLVDGLRILTHQYYKDIDMKDFTVMMRYVLPISKEYNTMILQQSTELYQDEYLEYHLPIDTDLTRHAGDIEFYLTFTKTEENPEAPDQLIQRVRKSQTSTIHITAISDWDQIIPDSALEAIDQRLVKTDIQIAELDKLAQESYEKQVDNLVLDDDGIALSAHGSKVGDSIDISDIGTAISEDAQKNSSSKLVTTVEF